jgi:SpoVK/Ycf46/Vps4 family AAA+-type ATPase
MPTKSSTPKIEPTALRAHQVPGSNNRGARYLPPTFNRRVRRFLAKHKIKSLIARGQERYLVISGPPGVGKTSGFLVAASELGFGVVVVSAAELAGDTEGAANRAFRIALADAEVISRHCGYPVVVLIDDMDLSIAGPDDGRTERTINSHLLMQDIQWLADNPRKYTTCLGGPVPVVFTGNDSRYRPSLFRDGRADRFTYQPTPDEQREIIDRLFKPTTTAETWTVRAIARAYSHKPVSFFAALKSDLDVERLDRVLDDGLDDIARIEAELAKPNTLDRRLLKRLAKLRASADARSHL